MSRANRARRNKVEVEDVEYSDNDEGDSDFEQLDDEKRDVEDTHGTQHKAWVENQCDAWHDSVAVARAVLGTTSHFNTDMMIENKAIFRDEQGKEIYPVLSSAVIHKFRKDQKKLEVAQKAQEPVKDENWLTVVQHIETTIDGLDATTDLNTVPLPTIPWDFPMEITDCQDTVTMDLRFTLPASLHNPVSLKNHLTNSKRLVLSISGKQIQSELAAAWKFKENNFHFMVMGARLVHYDTRGFPVTMRASLRSMRPRVSGKDPKPQYWSAPGPITSQTEESSDEKASRGTVLHNNHLSEIQQIIYLADPKFILNDLVHRWKAIDFDEMLRIAVAKSKMFNESSLTTIDTGGPESTEAKDALAYLLVCSAPSLKRKWQRHADSMWRTYSKIMIADSGKTFQVPEQITTDLIRKTQGILRNYEDFVCMDEGFELVLDPDNISAGFGAFIDAITLAEDRKWEEQLNKHVDISVSIKLDLIPVSCAPRSCKVTRPFLLGQLSPIPENHTSAH